ncbi:phosphoglycerate dehydrogenase [Jiangella rhizosphaerae]|nr:phosphoglycerate dehydrogenase [Jiangella rhizosphaerae]
MTATLPGRQPRPRSGDRVVLVTWPDYPGDASPQAARLTALGLTLRRAPRTHDRSEDELVELLDGCVAGIVSTDPFTRAVFEATPGLRLLSRVGVGTDSIDLEAAAEHGVGVTVARGANEEAVADHTIGLILALLRRIPELDRAVRDGRWLRTGEWAGRDLHGKTVGLLGMGAISQLVARRLHGFGVDIVGYDPVAPPPPGVRPARMVDVVTSADVLSLHLPLTQQTRNLVDAALLARMKPGAVLVNTSRGGIVDEQALADAIRAGRLRGAAIDVFSEEPPRTSPLLPLWGSTVLTPHIGGLSKEAIDQMVEHATGAVVAALTGHEPPDLVNRPVRAVWEESPNGPVGAAVYREELS